MAKQRKYFSSEEKVSVLRRRLLEGVSVSSLCDELSFKPTVFYRWQKEFFENGVAAFGPRHPSGQAGCAASAGNGESVLPLR
jgi:transposase-like protein